MKFHQQQILGPLVKEGKNGFHFMVSWKKFHWQMYEGNLYSSIEVYSSSGGLVRSRSYKNGVQHGIHKHYFSSYFDEKGEIRYKSYLKWFWLYNNGVRIIAIHYNHDGRIKNKRHPFD